MQSPQSTPRILRKARTSFVAALLSLLALANAAFAAVPNSEYLLLRAIYDGTNGSQWTRKNGWLENNSADVCTWYGITCNAAGTNVTEIRLAGNNLTGTLPPSLAGLPELMVFNVQLNQLTGSIPALTGSTKLKEFTADNNDFRFFIPSLAGLQSLEVFSAADNALTGPIPPLQNLPKLNTFRVGLNRLSGRIPDLSGVPSLISFFVEKNRLTGAIPPLSALTQLQGFVAYDNQLTGSLPQLDGLRALRAVLVFNNQLSGALPTPPGSLQPRQSILCLNQFTDSQSDAWNIAVTGSAATSWNTGCIPLRNQLLLSFGAPPVLTAGSFGQVNVTVSPAPSSQPLLFASLTPSVCTVQAEQLPRIDVSPNAPVGAVCTITADMAGDTNFNSAPQVQQDIVIAAAESPVSSVPALNPWAMLALVSWLAAIGAMFRRRAFRHL
jgi:Leucine rich repeat N-terminal domain